MQTTTRITIVMMSLALTARAVWAGEDHTDLPRPRSTRLAWRAEKPAARGASGKLAIAKRAAQGPLFAYQHDGLWGLVDVTGAVVFEPQFSNEPRFTDEFAQVTCGGRRLLLRENGDIVTPPDGVAMLRGPSEGLVAVNVGQEIKYGDILAKAGAWGVMDSSGKMVVPPRFAEIQPFAGGLAAALEERHTWGYIDPKGQWAIKPQFRAARAFAEGLAFVGVALPGERHVKFGCVDKTGKMVIPPEFLQATAFRDGLAAVKKGEKWGYIDRAGMAVTEFEYDSAGNMTDGLGLVWKWKKDAKGQITNAKCGFIDREGKLVTGLRFASGYDASDGMAAVQLGGKWGFVDATGQVVIKPQFGEPGAFAEGLAPVKIGAKYGYIDKTGATVITPQFEFAQPFSRGLARVTLKQVFKGEELVVRTFGYIDKQGKVVFSYDVRPRPTGVYEG